MSRLNTSSASHMRADSDSEEHHNENEESTPQPAPSNRNSRLVVPTGRLEITPKLLIGLDKSKLKIPTELITALTSKWKLHFNALCKEHKTIKEFSVILHGTWFQNCFGVHWNPPRLTFDRVDKIFSIHSCPTHHQDILCFEPVYGDNYTITVSTSKLKKAFTDFFTQVNRVKWCRACGSFAWSYQWNDKTGTCEKCIYHDICSSLSSETHHCSICQEDGKRMFKTHCGHHFHRACLSGLIYNDHDLGPRCPLCRTYINPSDDYWFRHNDGHDTDHDTDHDIDA